jgi:hypothetical protein
MTELPDKIKVLLKRFHPRPECAWMWETEQRRDQWLLPLYDDNDADVETGVVAVITINSTKRGKWGVGIYIKLEEGRSWRTDGLIFVSNTPEEAKRKVDNLLRLNSPEFPPSEDKNLEGLRAALKSANYPQIIREHCDLYDETERKLASGLEVSPGDRKAHEWIKARIQEGYSLRDVIVRMNVDWYLTLFEQNNPGILAKVGPQFREELFRVFAECATSSAELN